jgi:hypothetical protein
MSESQNPRYGDPVREGRENAARHHRVADIINRHEGEISGAEIDQARRGHPQDSNSR